MTVKGGFIVVVLSYIYVYIYKQLFYNNSNIYLGKSRILDWNVTIYFGVVCLSHDFKGNTTFDTVHDMTYLFNYS